MPLGGGVGHIFHSGRLPVNMQLAAHWNVIAPDNGRDWQLRFQVQFLFPKGRRATQGIFFVAANFNWKF